MDTHGNAAPRILFTFPTAWDRRQLAACRERWQGSFDIVLDEPTDEDCPWDFDVLAHVERLVARVDVDGITSTSDYPGATVAAAVATRRGLPGSDPAAVIGCSHKWRSRLTQRAVVPEATPAFDLVDPAVRDLSGLATGFPCFVKPVKGAFSVMARVVSSAEELRSFLDLPAVREHLDQYVAMFNRLVRALTTLEHDGSFFIAERVLVGHQVTVEGFEHEGDVEVLGVTDSVFHPGTRSFLRFDYPSVLPERVQERMRDVVRRFVRAAGLRSTLFNVEMIHDPATDAIAIVEANPRACGQFADLYEKVDGVNGYEVALALAAGRRPRLRRGAGRFRRAASFPLRVFQPTRVAHAPSEEDVASLMADEPGTLVWNECETGQDLSDFVSLEDGTSHRFAVVNLGGDDLFDLHERLDTVQRRLEWRFE